MLSFSVNEASEGSSWLVVIPAVSSWGSNLGFMRAKACAFSILCHFPFHQNRRPPQEE